MELFEGKEGYSSKDSARRNWFLGLTQVKPNITRVKVELLDQDEMLLDQIMCPELFE